MLSASVGTNLIDVKDGFEMQKDISSNHHKFLGETTDGDGETALVTHAAVLLRLSPRVCSQLSWD